MKGKLQREAKGDDQISLLDILPVTERIQDAWDGVGKRALYYGRIFQDSAKTDSRKLVS